METKNKIVKTAKICHIVSKVLYCASFAVCLTFIVLAIALAVTDAIEGFTPAETAIIFSTSALWAFIFIGLMWNVEGIFKCIVSEKTPFCEGVSHYLKKAAIFMLVISIVPAVLGTLLLSSICPASEFTFPVSISGIVAGAVLFLIGMFFKYGNELQKRDDETL